LRIAVSLISAISVAITIISVLALMLTSDLSVGLLVLIIQFIVKSRVFVRREVLIMRILMDLIKLVVHVGVLRIQLVMLSTVFGNRVCHCRNGKASQSQRTNSRYQKSFHVKS
jgi:hypothetical protein